MRPELYLAFAVLMNAGAVAEDAAPGEAPEETAAPVEATPQSPASEEEAQHPVGHGTKWHETGPFAGLSHAEAVTKMKLTPEMIQAQTSISAAAQTGQEFSNR